MPLNAPAAAQESQQLIAFLAHQRTAVVNACFGLEDAEAKTTTTNSVLTAGGLIEHLAYGERGWVGRMAGDFPGDTAPGDDALQEYFASFALGEGETLATALDDYLAAAALTDAAIEAEPDLGRVVVLARAPWLPAEDVSVRWIVLHLIEETARHAGHADIIRENLDGAASGSLMAAVEGWPEDGWITPWRRT